MKRTIYGLGLGTALLFATSVAQAATINVTTEIDELNADGDCSLREAVQAANTNAAVDACEAGAAGADTIVLPDNTYALTLVAAPEDANASGDLDITESIVFQGTSTAGTILDGNGTGRILHVVAAADVTASNLTLTNGSDPAGGSALLTTFTGTVTLTDLLVDTNVVTATGAVTVQSAGPSVLEIAGSTFSNNTAPAGATGTALTAIIGLGSATIADSSFEDNAALAGSGGAFLLQGGGNVPFTLDNVIVRRNEITTPGVGGGGLISSSGNITLTGITLEDNSAIQGAGLFLQSGGAAVITIDGGTISGNENPHPAPGTGGGLQITSNGAFLRNLTIDNNFNGIGGGVFATGNLSIENSTLSNNTAGVLIAPPPPTQGGGLFATGILTLENVTFSGNEATGTSSQGGAMMLAAGPGSTATNVTIVDNSAPAGSALASGGGSMVFKNSIITDSCFAPPGALSSAGHNIDRHNTCGFGGGVGDRTGTDPLLGPLADNGTSGRKTHLPLQGSPAIDNGDGAGAPATDARGVTRPLDGNGDGIATTDIGAAEIGCGDGVAQSFLGESCDDGNTDNNDACNNACTSTSCGDGVVNPGEECDNGAANSDTEADACRTTCTSARCGDGVVDAGETCDDGNTADGDACTSTCEEGAGTGGDSGGGCSLIR